MRGRKPIPAELRKLMGNPSKRPINDAELQATAGIPHCPTQLTGDSLAMWNRIIPELAGMGLLTLADEGAVVGYCLAYDDMLNNPGARYKAMTALRSLGSELGLSPVARTRLQSPTKDEDEFDRWADQGEAAAS